MNWQTVRLCIYVLAIGFGVGQGCAIPRPVRPACNSEWQHLGHQVFRIGDMTIAQVTMWKVVKHDSRRKA